jgi:ribose 5-phosphate isomerase B
MNIVIGSDHGGFSLKGRLIEEMRKWGHQVEDVGAYKEEPGDDYPDFSKACAEAVIQGRAERAILICGSGAGACVAANKFRGIRASTCHDSFSARQCVEDDNVNIMCMGARIVGPELAVDLVRIYLAAQFSGAERHRRRLAKIAAFEAEFGR